MQKSSTREDVFAAVLRGQRWRAGDAAVVLEAWAGSGLELEEFARVHGVQLQRLQRWCTRLDGSAPEAIEFHPVEVRQAERELAAPASGSEAQGSGVEVVVGAGRRIALGMRFDEEVLARVVRVLEGLPC